LTPVILDVLARSNAKATFFLAGRNIAGREEIVRQIAAGGHEICSHGYDHLHQWKVSPIRTIRDIKQGWQAIDKALRTNRGKYTFRPPYGKLNLVCLIYLLLCRVPIVYWSLNVGDTWPAACRNGNRIASIIERIGGAVTLAHDFDRSDSSADDMVVESTRLGLTAAAKAGVKILTVSQLLHYQKE
jgi:peptidoglycan/xylan/chitin deacetylase (PgdA/CDA1 family)